MGRVGLSEVLGQLREELDKAQKTGKGHQFRFEILEAEVELLIEVDAEGGAKGGVQIGVASFGAGGKVSRSDTHRLRLKLQVKDAATGGRNLEVGREKTGSWDG
jgi:Trypsin-co-occurring domain 2